MSFGSRLKEKREYLGITQPQLAQMLNVSKGAIGNWETDVNSPRATLLYDLFEILQCDANYLFQDETKELYKDEATPEEFEKLVKPYRNLDDYGRETIDIAIKRETDRTAQAQGATNTIEKLQRQLAISSKFWAYYGRIAAAGKSYGFEDVACGTIEAPLTDDNQYADYTIGVSGDSMEPDFSDGDIVYVQKTNHLNIDDIGIFQKDNCIYIKKVGDGQLLSINSNYDPIPGEDVKERRGH